MRPTRRAILAAALGLPVALLPVALHARLWPFWPVYLGVFALALGVDALLSPRRKEVGVAAEVPPLLSIGEAEEARLTVQLPSPRPVPVTLAVDLSDKLAPQGRLHGRASRDGAVFTCPLVATRRGEVAVERVWVRYTGPLGLMASVVRRDLGMAAAVVPNLRPVRTVALRFTNERDFRAGLKIERYTGDGTEFDSLREYAFGDDRRAVDWKSSARHGNPGASTEELRAALYDDGDGPAGILTAFAAFLFTHNARVGFLCFALGFAAGVPVLFLLFSNGLILGALAALYHSRGLSPELWAWLLPHGVTELTAVCLCGAAGLALGNAVVFPGPYTRLRNLALRGRDASLLVIGSVVLFFVAGLIEGLFRQLVHHIGVRWLVVALTSAFWIWYFLRVGRDRDASGVL